MSGTNLLPDKITSPFQLMAAWFAMLVLTVTILLTVATQIEHPTWAAGYLVIFASLVIVLVIGCVTLMLTKFRPHLQDGKEYAQWLKEQGQYSSGYIVRRNSSRADRVLKINQQKNHALRLKDDMLVSVVNMLDSVNLIEVFKNKGYNTELYESQKKPLEDYSQQEAIWVGSRVSPSAAITAIKTAIQIWPHLKYIHLSGDSGDPPDYVHDQIFFGGATDTAVSRYALKPWDVDELKELNESMDLETFHSEIRSKYP